MSARLRTLPFGEAGLLVELDDLDAVTELHRRLRADPPEGLVDAVPAARTLLVTVDPHVLTPQSVAELLARRMDGAPPAGATERPGQLVELDVAYDGPDLHDVAAALGVTTDQVAAWHSAATYHAAFFGFGPGFAYLAGLDPRLRMPRRTAPRTRVPAGSVAIADRFTAIYPWESPGGWHLLGRTDARLWQSERDPPNLLNPGDRVRFVPLERTPAARGA